MTRCAGNWSDWVCCCRLVATQSPLQDPSKRTLVAWFQTSGLLRVGHAAHQSTCRVKVKLTFQLCLPTGKQQRTEGDAEVEAAKVW